jgi:hypothetical protein
MSLGDGFYVQVPLSAELENQHQEVTRRYFSFNLVQLVP